MDRMPDTQQCCLAVAFKGAAWTDPDSVPLMVMQTMLGGWDRNNTSGKHAGSLLTQKIASDGLAEAYMAFNTNYHDTGLFGVYAVTDRERSENLAWILMNEVTRMCYEVKEADVARARNQLKASLLFLQDSSQREFAPHMSILHTPAAAWAVACRRAGRGTWGVRYCGHSRTRRYLSHPALLCHQSVLWRCHVNAVSYLATPSTFVPPDPTDIHTYTHAHTNTPDVAESIGRELLVYGRRVPKAEMFARIDAVDADTVRAVADRFLYDQDIAIAAVGDTQFLPDYNWCAQYLLPCHTDQVVKHCSSSASSASSTTTTTTATFVLCSHCPLKMTHHPLLHAARMRCCSLPQVPPPHILGALLKEDSQVHDAAGIPCLALQQVGEGASWRHTTA